MALHIPHSIFHLARLLYVRPVSFGPYYVRICGQHIQLRSVSGSMAGFCDFFFPRLLLVFDGHFFLISSAESLTWSLLQWQKSLQNKYTSGKYISRISCMQGEDTWLAESDFSVTSTQKKLLWRRVAFGNDCIVALEPQTLHCQVSRSHKIRCAQGRIPLKERSARRKGCYLHNKHNRRILLPSAGFEAEFPVIKRFQTYALDRTATGTGNMEKTAIEFHDHGLSHCVHVKDERGSRRACEAERRAIKDRQFHFGMWRKAITLSDGIQGSRTVPSERNFVKIKTLERNKYWFEIRPVELRFIG